MRGAESVVRAVLVGFAAITVLASCAVQAPQVELVPGDGITLEELEAAGYEGDGMTVELNDLMIAVDGQYGADPRYSGFEWSRDDQTLTLWWYGEVPADLVERLSAAGVFVAPTVNSPRELADAVQRIMAPGAVPGVFVSAAGPSIDCSKLSVTAESTGPSISVSEMTAAIEGVAGFPVDLEVGRIVPITGVASGF